MIQISLFDRQRWFSVLALVLILPVIAVAQTEICDNAIDDDADGLTDLNDDDCICMIAEPESLIPNPSFEELDCCPNMRSELDCATDWIQASEATTDFIHLCGWLGWDDFPPPMPFPDGEGIMGFRDGRVRSNSGNPEPFWKEYAGACLINPLLAGTTYRFEFDVGFVDPTRSPPIDITFFGTTDCDNLPFGTGNISFGCPTNSPRWDQLAEINVSGGTGSWVNTFLEITPTEDIYAIAIGPGCDPVITTTSLYYYFDNLLLADRELFDFSIREEVHPCDSDYRLSVPFKADVTYQWYLDGVALVGEVSTELSRSYGEGSYQVRVLDGMDCSVTNVFTHEIPVFETVIETQICDGAAFEFGGIEIMTSGSYVDTFTTVDNCDSIVSVDLLVVGESFDTVQVAILEGETYEVAGMTFDVEGDYPLTLTSSLGCDSLVLVRLDVFNIAIPNIFSPNGDSANDTFYPVVPPDQVASMDMLIYDRWGNLVYYGLEWDGGDYHNGVYAYVITVAFITGGSKTFTGSLTLLR